MTNRFRIGDVDVSASEFATIVRVMEGAWKSERGRVSAFKGTRDAAGEHLSAARAGELEALLRKLGWKGPRRRAAR